MAEDKKPKIDLKTRLQKMGGAVPPSTASGSIPVPPAPLSSIPPIVPVPPGVTPTFQSSPPAVQSTPHIDPSHPLAAAAGVGAPFRAQATAAVAQPQRIEVDEGMVEHARKGVRKQMLGVAAVVGAIFAVLGWAGGSASEKGAATSKSKEDAKHLAGEIDTSKASLTKLADLVEGGAKSLLARKFPDSLSRDLAAINVDFTGAKLAGVRFSGISADATRELFEYITAVQSVNDKKRTLQGLLTRLQKPLTEEFAAVQSGAQPPIQWAIVVDKRSGAEGAPIVALAEPVTRAANAPMPGDFTFLNPQANNAKTKLPRFAGNDKDSVVPIIPQTFERACPSETKGQVAQLLRGLGSLKADIRAEKAAAASEGITEDKADLIERSDRLIKLLTK